MKNTEPKKVDALTIQEAKDQIAYKLYKTDFKYVSLDVCKVAILEQAAELYCLEQRKRTWDEACEAMRSSCTQRFYDNTETQLRIGSVSKPEFKP